MIRRCNHGKYEEERIYCRYTVNMKNFHIAMLWFTEVSCMRGYYYDLYPEMLKLKFDKFFRLVPKR